MGGLPQKWERSLDSRMHGNRRVTRLEPNGSLTVVADRYDGKRFNSPRSSKKPGKPNGGSVK
jgi:gluconolactonase